MIGLEVKPGAQVVTAPRQGTIINFPLIVGNWGGRKVGASGTIIGRHWRYSELWVVEQPDYAILEGRFGLYTTQELTPA